MKWEIDYIFYPKIWFLLNISPTVIINYAIRIDRDQDNTKKPGIRLAPQQHEFKLHGSTHTRIFFFNKYSVQ